MGTRATVWLRSSQGNQLILKAQAVIDSAGLILNTGTYWDLLWVDVSALGAEDMVTNRSAKPSIVRTWLQFLAIPTYVSNFEENGFEDLETIKLICEKDLLEIGVDDQHHRQIILASVKILKEQGAAWVYLLLASQEQQLEKKEKKEEEETQEDDGEELFALCSFFRDTNFCQFAVQRFIIQPHLRKV